MAVSGCRSLLTLESLSKHSTTSLNGGLADGSSRQHAIAKFMRAGGQSGAAEQEQQ